MVTVDLLPPTETESFEARESYEKLAPFVEAKQPLTFIVANEEHQEPIQLPEGVVALLRDILEAMAAGHGITLIPQHAELTTVEAADILHVSRPYLIKLLETGEIPFHKVGRHRRIRREDVMAYKEAIDQRREAVLDELVAESQELGLYD